MTTLERLRLRFPVLMPPKVKAEARVAIAEDVLETLLFGRMKVQSSHGYFQVDDAARGVVEDSFETVALTMKTRGRTMCTVCAIGAACVSAVSLYNKAPAAEKVHRGEIKPSKGMRTVLGHFFTRKQLDLIECAFEMKYTYDIGGSSWDARYEAHTFGQGYRYNDRERLEAIMQNIIDNGGTFRP